MTLALVVAGCGEVSAPSPAWSFAPAPSSAAPTAVTSPSDAATLAPSASPTAAPAAGLGATCAVQWAASISTYADENDGAIQAVLLPPENTEAPPVEPTSASLQTDQGPTDLSVATVSGLDDDLLPGTTRLELGLPVLEPGTYRAEFLDLADESGTWRFRVGEFVINVLPGTAPDDLERTSGTEMSGAYDEGSVQGFEIGLRNTTGKAIEVTGASTDIPGLPVKWVLVERDPVRRVDSVAIPAGGEVTVLVGTESTDKPVSFVLVTPEIAYRIGDDAERHKVFDPIEFQSGFGQPSDVTAYRATLPADACATRH
jgi:hypothetical protein